MTLLCLAINLAPYILVLVVGVVLDTTTAPMSPHHSPPSLKTTKGEMSTVSGSSVAATSRASEPVVPADGLDGESVDLAELERECERVLMETPLPKDPVKETPKVKPPVSGNIAQALSGGGGLTPSQLHTPELEEQVVSEMKQLSDEQFQSLSEDLKQHPEFPSYCEGIRLELDEGGDDDDAKWVWGEQEPYLDVVGLLVWAKAKQNMSHALGLTPSPLTSPAPPAPAASPPLPAVTTPVNPGAHPALTAKPAESPAPSPKTVTPVPAQPSPKVPAELPAPVVVTPANPSEMIVPTPHTTFFVRPAEPPAPSPKAVPPVNPVEVTPANPAPKAVPPVNPVAVTPANPAEPPAPPPKAVPPVNPVEATPANPAELPAPSPVSVAPTAPPAVVTPANPTPAASDLSSTVDAVVADVQRDNKPNSSTHRKEYMAFLRAAKNPIFG